MVKVKVPHQLVKQYNNPYDKDAADEFVLPTVIDAEGNYQRMAMLLSSVTSVQTVGVNFTKALVLPEFDGFNREPLSLYMATMTKYEDGLPVHIVYEKDTSYLKH